VYKRDAFRIRSLRLEAVYKFWQMISKSVQLKSICSTVNRELQGIHILLRNAQNVQTKLNDSKASGKN